MQPQFLQHVTFKSLEVKPSQRKHQTFSWSPIGNRLLARLAPLCSFPEWDLEVFGELPTFVSISVSLSISVSIYVYVHINDGHRHFTFMRLSAITIHTFHIYVFMKEQRTDTNSFMSVSR